MQFHITVLAIALLPFSGYAQYRLLKGETRNKETNEPLPYVSIGIKHKNAGTVSDKDGRFSLYLPDSISMQDTILFSHVGFETIKQPVAGMNEKQVLLLTPDTKQLEEVVFSYARKKRKARKIGRNDNGLGLMHYNFYTYYEKNVDDRLSKEVGMNFNIKSNCKINNLNFHVSQNEFTSLKFRVNIYKTNNGIPTELLIDDNIIFEIKNNFRGWFSVDLNPYNIYLKENEGDVAVTIQWLESTKSNEKSKYFSISASNSPFHTVCNRNKAMDKWTTQKGNLSFFLNAMCE